MISLTLLLKLGVKRLCADHNLSCLVLLEPLISSSRLRDFSRLFNILVAFGNVNGKVGFLCKQFVQAILIFYSD